MFMVLNTLIIRPGISSRMSDIKEMIDINIKTSEKFILVNLIK